MSESMSKKIIDNRANQPSRRGLSGVTGNAADDEESEEGLEVRGECDLTPAKKQRLNELSVSTTHTLVFGLGMPANMVDSSVFRAVGKSLGLAPVSRHRLQVYSQHQEKELVVDPTRAQLKDGVQPVNVGQHMVSGIIGAQTDCLTRNNRTVMTVGLSVMKLENRRVTSTTMTPITGKVTTSLSERRLMIPVVMPAAVAPITHSGLVGDAGAYHGREVLQSSLARFRDEEFEPKDFLRATATDNEGTATLAAVEVDKNDDEKRSIWETAYGGKPLMQYGCNSHKGNLALKSISDCPQYKTITTPFFDVSDWLRLRPQLLRHMCDKAGIPHLMPIAHCNTRFYVETLILGRMLKLYPVFSTVDDLKSHLSTDDAKALRAHKKECERLLDAATWLYEGLKPVTQIIPGLGCDRSYGISLGALVASRYAEHVTRLKEKMDAVTSGGNGASNVSLKRGTDLVHQTCALLRDSMGGRLKPVQLMDENERQLGPRGLAPAISKVGTSTDESDARKTLQYQRAQKDGVRIIAAAILDPATSRSMLQVVWPGYPTAAPLPVMAEVMDLMAEVLYENTVGLSEATVSSGAVAALTSILGGTAGARPQVAMDDPRAAYLTAVTTEVASLAGDVLAASFQPGIYLPPFLIFDDDARAVAEKHDTNYINRHAFWPSQQSKYPHLFAVARILLLGPSNSMFCERMNSIARLVLTHLRSRLTDENKEHAILAYYHLRAVLAKHMTEKEAHEALEELEGDDPGLAERARVTLEALLLKYRDETE